MELQNRNALFQKTVKITTIRSDAIAFRLKVETQTTCDRGKILGTKREEIGKIVLANCSLKGDYTTVSSKPLAQAWARSLGCRREAASL